VRNEAFVDVIDVPVLTRYVLRLTFSTGEVGELNVEEFLWGLAFEALAPSLISV
jgi:hypothetical protein